MALNPPAATYRLQFGPGFGFEDARRVVPYLKALGVSHVYLSPVWTATPGSTHGYDVVDHASVNEHLGGLGGLYALWRTAEEHGLGLIFDIVPNHVGIANHPWWRDVLRFGPQSPYASWFDIDWEGQPQQQTGVLVYPVLGQPFGSALESGELSLEYDGAEIVVRYYESTFPIAPSSYPAVLGLPPPIDDEAGARDVVTILEALPRADPPAATILLERLAAQLARSPALGSWASDRADAFNGNPGDPQSFDRLDALLQQQHYRLAYWRVSAEEINYRRFFDINDLAAIRTENPAVFEATHALLAELIAAGVAAGLRVDHVDGLYDPGAYLNRLRQLANGGAPGEGRPIWVEKILAHEERLPSSWPVEGTTGYDFLAVAGGLFMDAGAEQAFGAIYEDFTGERVRYDDVAFGARRRIAGRSFAGEVRVLAMSLYRLAQQRRLARDNTLGALQDAIAALLSTMPVYRTYLDQGEPMPADAGLISSAAAEALRRDPNVTPEAMSFLVQVLLLDTGGESGEERARWVHFRRRFQQLSGPVMAKGVEDTTFFRFHRLLACNEVGADPGVFGTPAAAAHAWFAQRAIDWPRSLSATTTHDTKRSEDARMRLTALTWFTRAWHSEVRAWRRMNARHRGVLRGREVPDRNTEYYIYQSLVASWTGEASPRYVERMQSHAIKAAREAKLQTSWARVDEPYEELLRAFVAGVLRERKTHSFVRRLNEFVRVIEPIARLSMLGLLTLKATAPGIPDFYQGSEFALHTLTDPDNRGPVDFERASERLREEAAERPPAGDPAAKPWLTRMLLALRNAHPRLFIDGAYTAVEPGGDGAATLFAFERWSAEARCMVVLPHRLGEISTMGGRVRSPLWESTWIDLGGDRTWTDWLTGRQFEPGQQAPVSDLLAEFPVAVLLAAEEPHDE